MKIYSGMKKGRGWGGGVSLKKWKINALITSNEISTL